MLYSNRIRTFSFQVPDMKLKRRESPFLDFLLGLHVLQLKLSFWYQIHLGAMQLSFPFFNNVLQPCLMIHCVPGFLVFHPRTVFNTTSGLSFAISFKLFATLLLTYSEGSSFRFSRIGKIGEGFFINAGIALAQGSLGLHPSELEAPVHSRHCVLTILPNVPGFVRFR